MDRTTYYHSVGQERFREVERNMLLRADPKAVIATGGGIVLQEKSRVALGKFERVAFLKVEKAILEKRIEMSPLPSKQLSFEEMYQSRLPLYQSVATEIWDGK